jgi:hypothetical protein
MEVKKAELTPTNPTVGREGEKEAGKGFAAAVTDYGKAGSNVLSGNAGCKVDVWRAWRPSCVDRRASDSAPGSPTHCRRLLSAATTAR